LHEKNSHRNRRFVGGRPIVRWWRFHGLCESAVRPQFLAPKPTTQLPNASLKSRCGHWSSCNFIPRIELIGRLRRKRYARPCRGCEPHLRGRFRHDLSLLVCNRQVRRLDRHAAFGRFDQQPGLDESLLRLVVEIGGAHLMAYRHASFAPSLRCSGGSPRNSCGFGSRGFVRCFRSVPLARLITVGSGFRPRI
jgi:hypothetical protein